MGFEDKVLQQLDRIQSDMKDMRADISDIREEQKSMRADINDIRADISDIREEQKSMRADINDIREEQKSMRADINDIREEQQSMKQTLTRVAVVQENTVLPQIQLLLEGHTDIQRQITELSVIDRMQDDIITLKTAVRFLSEKLEELHQKHIEIDKKWGAYRTHNGR